jgi:competence protein ComEA
MKRFTIAIAVAAIVTALATMAFAQGENPSTTPATPAAEPAKPAAKPATKSSTSKAHATHHYDLNAATREDLLKLPGINEELADKIIAARPYKSKSELESKKILSSKEYSKIHTMVMVKSSTMAGNTAK